MRPMTPSVIPLLPTTTADGVVVVVDQSITSKDVCAQPPGTTFIGCDIRVRGRMPYGYSFVGCTIKYVYDLKVLDWVRIEHSKKVGQIVSEAGRCEVSGEPLWLVQTDTDCGTYPSSGIEKISAMEAMV
jgi:hypothetical protein